MKTHYKRVTGIAVMAAIALAAFALAAPADALDPYTPALDPDAASAVVANADDVATYRPVATAKKAAPVPAPAKSRPRGTSSAAVMPAKAASGGGGGSAEQILAGLIARYPILAGTTVQYGDARGYQAVAYYRSGRIVISKNHTASLSRILNHEVWHIIDYRDNGKIDWGESVPPKNAASFRN